MRPRDSTNKFAKHYLVFHLYGTVQAKIGISSRAGKRGARSQARLAAARGAWEFHCSSIQTIDVTAAAAAYLFFRERALARISLRRKQITNIT